MSRDRCVVLFSKPARPGRVKTRLIGDLTAVQAAELHQAFLDDLRERLSRGRFELRIAWALDADEALPETAVRGFRQRGADLGARLHAGLTRTARGHRFVAAVGSDHPELELERVESAFEHLEAGAEMVLGPASDGGYYLVAAAADALDRRLFEDIPWSTGNVLATTLERAAELGLRVELLPEGHDVDTPEDLRRLVRALGRGGASCPRTRELLASWGEATA